MYVCVYVRFSYFPVAVINTVTRTSLRKDVYFDVWLQG